MGFGASLLLPTARTPQERERFATICGRVVEALKIQPPPPPPPPPPAALLSLNEEDSVEIGPYSWLHLLRRAALVANADQPHRFLKRLTPSAASRDPLMRASMKDWDHTELSEHVLQRNPCPVAEVRALLDATAHLVHHEDHTGLYLPWDFSQPLWVRDPMVTSEFEYTSVGSAVALARELNSVRCALEIPPDVDVNDERLLAVLDDPPRKGPPWLTNPEATYVAICLGRLVDRSLKTNLAIVFE
jgi:hypothetical protein